MPEEAHQFGLLNDIPPNEDGVISAGNEPGLGHKIDWDYIERHRIKILK